jgi:hypothetical protein
MICTPRSHNIIIGFNKKIIHCVIPDAIEISLHINIKNTVYKNLTSIVVNCLLFSGLAMNRQLKLTLDIWFHNPLNYHVFSQSR